MDPRQFLAEQFADHEKTVAATKTMVADAFAQLADACTVALESGNKIIFFGNGGSAADAQHLAAELVVRYRLNGRALAALALTTDTSILTACSNDFSYDDIFARQIEALLRPGDVVIGISTSGNSPNVLKALEAARDRGGVATGLSGRDGGKMTDLCDPLIVIPSNVTARIQEMHILIGHALCDVLEQRLRA
ncbi:D-sedoheptulose 7-phosphate isomerase [Magnetospirillum gryphiswaldense]|uniref:Phosphoheptose isomerase n=1 Tax=Magnetospirillum gryphiswaldense TaxID=55518 RepID=A4U2X8_9PROT|nr:D-sedoheptulose 7-phosphate isomerase [Magnetospirillum gryphiswaldense]AVM75644.1 Phosphoheptose isomerase 1 [Magnetospirillum gryphiswaldense MSR-1]AVM79547.1 Phosphoheptose isomerase 1 [Magnetospirillum gryphiswaldense]CAM77235.1 Phosphoheptose isomerase [Magnetospirillum gryphiswaldense MSR-1]